MSLRSKLRPYLRTTKMVSSTMKYIQPSGGSMNVVTTKNKSTVNNCSSASAARFQKADFSSIAAFAMTSEREKRRSYEDAINTLNSLQSNLQVVQMIAANRKNTQGDSVPGTVRYFEKTGVSVDELDALNVIHVAGTKGKGSTCALVESMLRHAGLKTGFYSSPHLISVRERIRINGKPISEEMFTKYFFESFDSMFAAKESEDDMPSYFRFLTCMAYRLFLKEGVQVAVMEVGIGGLYDPTNIIRNPVVVGITSLGIDHQAILGDTVEDIAEQKAGIMKENVPAFTVHDVNESVFQVLESCATKAKCEVRRVLPLDQYQNFRGIDFGIGNETVTKVNASLAVQLVNTFMNIKGKESENPFQLQEWQIAGLRNCRWPGRFQHIKHNDKVDFYLDGAHTIESFQASVQWFSNVCDSDSLKVLVFHVTGFRQAKDLLAPFVKSNIFDKMLCCPVVSTSAKSADNWSKVESDVNLRSRCEAHQTAWNDLYREIYGENAKVPESFVCDSIENVINWVENDANSEANVGKKRNVLVTGSLHLVGTFLSVLDPRAC